MRLGTHVSKRLQVAVPHAPSCAAHYTCSKTSFVERLYVVIQWGVFLSELMSNPLLVVVTLLNMGVIVVNGATDAPNAIASVVGTRSMPAKYAIIMAACCDFFGLLFITLISSAVANTIFHMVDFGGDQHAALMALMAAMVAIIIWGATAWFFGIPTSQSHSLIAGLTGAAIALQGGLGGINMGEWMKVIYGILLSTFMGFTGGWLVSKLLTRLCENVDRRRADKAFRWAQVVAGASVSLMHGAQDGQKFMGIFVLAITLATGVGQADQMMLPVWLMLFCAINMGTGTALGGKKIIKSVAVDMVKMEKYQGFAASITASVSLLVATLFGLPVSTTHTANTAIMGVGAAKRASAVKWGVAVDMVKTWVLTFPGCGLMGFVVAKLFLMIG